ncbi:MAG: YfhO family protein [Brumimicrobium sp.]|nr:YfhO family protein [Brumimicrobium sp.]
MSKINFSSIFKKNWIHILAFGLFILSTVLYFRPQFSGYGLKQHDIEQFKGASNEINYFRDTQGKEPLWTNSMFGGMPTYQISTKYDGNLLVKTYKAMKLWMDSPAGMFFMFLIGFYIMLLCMKVDPKVAILGAFAFAFSSYFIIVLQAGHNTKAAAIGMAPPVIGAFYMAYRGSIKWGLLLSAFFMGMEIATNHIQITYYLGIVLLFFGLEELIRHIANKEIVKFLKVTAGLFVVYVFALAINYGNLSLTEGYSKYTIRGGNDITIGVDGSSNHHNTTSGLDKDYITQWSYGIKESMTLVSPNVFGGGSAALKNSQFSDLLKSSEFRKEANLVADNNVYWGDQPFTSGPVYLGIIVFYLAVLAMVYLKGRLKWFLMIATILMLMLSWGKNFMGLTDFFIDHVPFYNKFRAVTIILAMVELLVPLLGVLFLDYLFKNKEEIKKNLRPFYITTGALVGVFILLTVTGLGNGYMSQPENDFLYTYPDQVRAQIAKEDPDMLLKNGIDVTNPRDVQRIVDRQMERVNEQFDALASVRKSIYQSSMLRSIFFMLAGGLLVVLYVKTETKKEYIIGGLAFFIVIDLVMVDLNYLNNEKKNGRFYDYWVEKENAEFPLNPTQADKQIMDMEIASNPDLKTLIDKAAVSSNKNSRRDRGNQAEMWSRKFQALNLATNYRVFEPALGFNSARASYFHKALNGYHGAKLRRIQNLKDFQIDYNNMNVINMLNVKYIIQGDQAMQNPGALGAVWLVKNLIVQPNPDKEILALGNLFVIDNKSDQTLWINDEKINSDTISGREKIYLLAGNTDTLHIDIRTVTQSSINSSYVEDVNGVQNWIPTAELAKDSLGSFKTLITVNKVYDFTPADDAIIGAKDVEGISSLTFSGQGEIAMKSYLPNEMKYEVNLDENQFAVFSEIYYPDGWKVYANGEELPIHRVDYLLRGVELPKGNYELEMRFEVPKYKTSNTVALAASSILLLLMAGFFVKDFLLGNKEEEK